MGSFRLAVQQISRIFNMSLFNKIILVFILGCCLGQEEEPETSALFKNIKIPLVNINIKKPRVTKTFSVPVIRKNVNTINRSKNPTTYNTYPKSYTPTNPKNVNTINRKPGRPGVGVIPTVTISPTGSSTVLQTLISDDRFSTLVAAVTAANITQETIDSIAPVTIFAPTNAAFAKIDNSTLTTLLADPVALNATLLRHIVPGKAVRIPEGTTQLENGVGGQISISRSLDDIYSESVTVRSGQGSGKILDFDILGSDGVIFSVDSVL